MLSNIWCLKKRAKSCNVLYMHLLFGVFFLPLQICHHKNRHLWIPINNAVKNSKFDVPEWFLQKRKKIRLP